jgi:flagellar biosynthesis/type III secretory pathway protein FliH
VLTPEEIERERYESRLKKQRDDKWLLYAAREDGREEGWKQGLEEGRKQGLEEGREEGRQEGLEESRQEGRKQGALIQSIQMCQRILKLPMTAQDELLKITPAVLAAMADTMEKQALVPAEVR